MLRRLLALPFVLVLALATYAAPAEAAPPRGDLYEKGTYDEPYSFEDDGCGFVFEVEGRARGHYATYEVPGSDGQAYLANDWYRWREVLTNPANGKQMYLSGHGYFREVSGTHVEGDLWEFVSVDTGVPFLVRDGDRKIVLKDHGRLVRSDVYDTLGDGQPGAEFVSGEVVRMRGDFPSLADDFDFCAMVSELIG